MLTSLRKSSSVSSFSLTCFRFRQCTEFLLFLAQIRFQCPFVPKDSLICFADRGEGDQHSWYVSGDFRFINFTTFLLFNFFYPRHLPTPTTHDLYPLCTHEPRLLATLVKYGVILTIVAFSSEGKFFTFFRIAGHVPLQTMT